MIISGRNLTQQSLRLQPMQNKSESARKQLLFTFSPNRNSQEQIQRKGIPGTQVITRIECFKQDQKFLLFFYFKDNRNYLRFSFNQTGTDLEITTMHEGTELKYPGEIYELGLPDHEINTLGEKMKSFGFKPGENFWSFLAPFNQSRSSELNLPAF